MLASIAGVLLFPFLAALTVVAYFVNSAIYSLRPIMMFCALGFLWCLLFGTDLRLALLYGIRAGLVVGAFMGFCVTAYAIWAKPYTSGRYQFS